MIYLALFTVLVMGICAGSICTSFVASHRIADLQQALRNSISKESVRYHINSLLMPDHAYKTKDKEKAGWWNGALKTLEHERIEMGKLK